ncbi:hypothetical protein M514_02262 [Trichuris suis]|uniref:Mos1 transposase HTH domain-containing protein n=1 Tax=Trichuris suis TaxID=68888 RepID=A0A085MIF9_9BILA|nr:hypothetical protein M513_02262 [Trichuris suis]KFD70104.1 hypothetical protein M514_02262 [Trichuris suis]
MKAGSLPWIGCIDAEAFQQPTIIKALFRERVTGEEIHLRLLKVYKDDALFYPWVKFWIRSLAGAENPPMTNQGLVSQLKPPLTKMLQLWRKWFCRTEEPRLQKSWHGKSEGDLFGRVVTGDDLWSSRYDPESEQQNMQCKHTDSLRSVRARIEP